MCNVIIFMNSISLGGYNYIYNNFQVYPPYTQYREDIPVNYYIYNYAGIYNNLLSISPLYASIVEDIPSKLLYIQ